MVYISLVTSQSCPEIEDHGSKRTTQTCVTVPVCDLSLGSRVVENVWLSLHFFRDFGWMDTRGRGGRLATLRLHGRWRPMRYLVEVVIVIVIVVLGLTTVLVVGVVMSLVRTRGKVRMLLVVTRSHGWHMARLLRRVIALSLLSVHRHHRLRRRSLLGALVHHHGCAATWAWVPAMCLHWRNMLRIDMARVRRKHLHRRVVWSHALWWHIHIWAVRSLSHHRSSRGRVRKLRSGRVMAHMSGLRVVWRHTMHGHLIVWPNRVLVSHGGAVLQPGGWEHLRRRCRHLHTMVIIIMHRRLLRRDKMSRWCSLWRHGVCCMLEMIGQLLLVRHLSIQSPRLRRSRGSDNWGLEHVRIRLLLVNSRDIPSRSSSVSWRNASVEGVVLGSGVSSLFLHALYRVEAINDQRTLRRRSRLLGAKEGCWARSSWNRLRTSVHRSSGGRTTCCTGRGEGACGRVRLELHGTNVEFG